MRIGEVLFLKNNIYFEIKTLKFSIRIYLINNLTLFKLDTLRLIIYDINTYAYMLSKFSESYTKLHGRLGLDVSRSEEIVECIR